jgi:hypothetical protein
LERYENVGVQVDPEKKPWSFTPDASQMEIRYGTPDAFGALSGLILCKLLYSVKVNDPNVAAITTTSRLLFMFFTPPPSLGTVT